MIGEDGAHGVVDGKVEAPPLEGWKGCCSVAPPLVVGYDGTVAGREVSMGGAASPLVVGGWQDCMGGVASPLVVDESEVQWDGTVVVGDGGVGYWTH